MLTGIDDVDWGSLGHAYGPADDVPSWIRGLVDLDPEVREESLDAILGAVHHQGDIYDSTVAALPFLIEIAVTPDVPDRHRVVDLLTSISDISRRSGEDKSFERTGEQARILIVDAAPRLLDLAGQPDPALRAATPPLLASLAADVPGVSALLTERLSAEPDAEVRRVLLASIGSAGVATGETGLVSRLLGVAASAPASTAVAALIAALRLDTEPAAHQPEPGTESGAGPAPRNAERIPLDGIAELLERAYAEDGTPVEPAGFTTDTLAGSLRVLREQGSEVRRAPHCDRLVEDLTDVLGPRVEERTAILLPLLASPHADLAGDALWAVNKLVDAWRGEYREIVARVGDLVAAGGDTVLPARERFGTSRAAVAERAEGFLADWTPVSGPATEVMAARLAALDAAPHRADGRPAWASSHGFRPCVEVLAGQGDERAFPMLMAALDWPKRPRNLPFFLSRYPLHAERIVAGITDPADFVAVLNTFGPTAAPLIPKILAGPLPSHLASALGRIGPAASEAVPVLRAAAAGDDPSLAVAAAGALWRIERWDGTLPALTARIESTAGAMALTEIAELGPAAGPAVSYLATFLDTEDRHWWRPARAALALWSATGDAERVTPVLTAAWWGNAHTRTPVAEAGIPSLKPLFAEEIAAKRRHNARDDGRSSDQVAADERLLAACRAALAQED
jgi:hypothetical protein